MADENLLGEIKRNIATKLNYLKSCDNYSTPDALSTIIFLRETAWSMTPGNVKERFSSKLIDFMIEQGLAPLVVKMIRFLTSVNNDNVYVAFHELHQMIYTIAAMLPKAIAIPIREELIKSGILQAVVEDLNTCDPNTTNPRQRIRAIDNLHRLQDLVLTPGAVLKYREQDVVPTLMNYLLAEDVNIKVFSLQVLACIVNEEESKHLGASGCMGAMIDMLRKAVEAPDRIHHYIVKVSRAVV